MAAVSSALQSTLPSTLSSSTPTPSGLAIDARAIDGLRGRAHSDPKGAVKEVAKQFEALFMSELLKSMRATTMNSGGLDNEGSKLGTEMLDAQLAQKMTGLPGGLSHAIQRQLERQMGLFPGPIPKAESANTSALPLDRIGKATAIPQTGAAAFVSQHTQAAQEAEKRTGIPAAFMVSQAALETGWGRKEIRHSDGTPAFNLFGIKAGGAWKGAVAEVATTEYIDGKPHKVKAKFRAYASYAESFKDYAQLMAQSPRYQQVAAASSDASGFARSLQRAGYATDPAYADKLTRVINTTLRLQRTLV
jgi:peptidoglycan hydrolase FlgJ